MGQNSGREKPSEIGDWKIGSELGAGGQATVWRVRYSKSRHAPPGALKLCASTDEKAVARFKQETRLLRSVSHPGIVEVKDHGEYEGRPFFVMPCAATSIEGTLDPKTAGTRLLRESVGLLLRLFCQACEGVAHLHGKGILHRDIKPSNILLMLAPPDPMRAVVSDLGVGSPAGEQGALTATKEVLGSGIYRAPEVLTGRAHTERSDVYSLGRTLEAVISGRSPQEHLPKPLPRHAELTEDLWRRLDAAIARASAFDPASRFADVGALIEALPRAVLGSADSAGNIDPTPADVELSTAAIKVLSLIIGHCPTEGDLVSPHYVNRSARLPAYEFAMGMRELSDHQFYEHSERLDDESGEPYSGIRPTDVGYNWARTHNVEVKAATAPPKPDYSDDDIPF